MNQERREQILNHLSQKNFITVKDMAKQIHVSEPTVRRAFRELEKEGLIYRNHGGASYLADKHNQWPLAYRSRSHLKEKTYIAQLAAAYVNDGDYIFLDSGSTCYCMAKELTNFHNLRVLSHGHPAIHVLSENENIIVECMGGTYSPKHDATFGYEAIDFIQKRHAKLFITSGYCLNIQYGSMETFEEEVPVKKAFSENADKTILLMDTSKYRQVGYFQTLNFDQIDVIVSDQKPPEEFIHHFEAFNIEYVY